MFFFAFLVAMLTSLIFGLLPALQSTRVDLVPALRNEASSGKSRRWHPRDYMVAAQVGISALLLVCSVLVVRGLQQALHAPIGYNHLNAVTASFDLNLQGYKKERGEEFQRRLLERVRAIPGIQSAALADMLPLTLNSSNDEIHVEGRSIPQGSNAPVSIVYSVSPGYFRTMETRILKGREFSDRDRKDAPAVAVVNQTFAKNILPGEDPIGRRFSIGPGGKMVEIVGVAEDGKYFALSENPKAAFWIPLQMFYSSNAALVARSAIPDQALRQIETAVREIDPGIALYATATMTQQLDLPLFPARVAAAALSAFGLLVVILAATGIYGVMAYAVSRRTREIGIRIAIGANHRQVLGSIARSALILVGSGTMAGLGLALVVGRLLKQILYGIEPADPLTFAIVPAMLLVIGALACWIPARRAMRIDPIQALRNE